MNPPRRAKQRAIEAIARSQGQEDDCLDEIFGKRSADASNKSELMQRKPKRRKNSNKGNPSSNGIHGENFVEGCANGFDISMDEENGCRESQPTHGQSPSVSLGLFMNNQSAKELAILLSSTNHSHLAHQIRRKERGVHSTGPMRLSRRTSFKMSVGSGSSPIFSPIYAARLSFSPEANSPTTPISAQVIRKC